MILERGVQERWRETEKEDRRKKRVDKMEEDNPWEK